MSQNSPGWPLQTTLICVPSAKDQETIRIIARFMEARCEDRASERPLLFHAPSLASYAVVELVKRVFIWQEDARLLEKRSADRKIDEEDYSSRYDGNESYLDLEMRVRSFVVDLRSDAVGKTVFLLAYPVWASMFRRVVLKQSMRSFIDELHRNKRLQDGNRAVYEPKLHRPDLLLEEVNWNVALI